MMQEGRLTPIPAPPPASAAFAAPGTGADLILPVRFIRQEQNNWCWAACGEMLIQYYKGASASQCQMASRHFGLQCCGSPLDPSCDQGAWPEEVYHHHGVTLDKAERPLDAAEVAGELRARTPVEVYYQWTGGGAHVAVVTGQYANGDILVHDPWYGPGRRTHEAVLDGYGLGAWTQSYRTGG